MAKFKIGDVVRLRSGGADMTVYAVHEDDGFVNTVWTDGNDKADTLNNTSPACLDLIKSVEE